ncbi:MAG: hypothetical protein Q4A82_05105 [Corynebacterium sp.]|nr:hypothetical protein [Corynebacterium sp.]
MTNFDPNSRRNSSKPPETTEFDPNATQIFGSTPTNGGGNSGWQQPADDDTQILSPVPQPDPPRKRPRRQQPQQAPQPLHPQQQPPSDNETQVMDAVSPTEYQASQQQYEPQQQYTPQQQYAPQPGHQQQPMMGDQGGYYSDYPEEEERPPLWPKILAAVLILIGLIEIVVGFMDGILFGYILIGLAIMGGGIWYLTSKPGRRNWKIAVPALVGLGIVGIILIPVQYKIQSTSSTKTQSSTIPAPIQQEQAPQTPVETPQLPEQPIMPEQTPDTAPSLVVPTNTPQTPPSINLTNPSELLNILPDQGDIPSLPSLPSLQQLPRLDGNDN